MADQFAVLRPAVEDDVLGVLTPDKNLGEVIRCPVDKGHQRGGKWQEPKNITFKKVPDTKSLVWTWRNELLVSGYVLEILRSHDLTSFSAKSVISRIRTKEISEPRLYELNVTGWGGVASKQSGVRRTFHCPSCGHSVYSGNVTADDIFDRKLWDGSDFFFVWPAPRFIFVHERVIRALVAESISGWTAARPDAVKFGDTLTPGNLEMWLPPERILDVRLNYSEEYWEFFE